MLEEEEGAEGGKGEEGDGGKDEEEQEGHISQLWMNYKSPQVLDNYLINIVKWYRLFRILNHAEASLKNS